jgi:DNA-binding LytR/AlgR family response regulator
MKAPSAIVAEDEAPLREQLIEQLHALWPELRIVAAAGDGVEALRLLEELRPDILFLDIQMPGASGQEVARAAAGHCHIVFVTAFDQHAVQAFEQGAVDYVLKPDMPARLFSTICRLRERINSAPPRTEAVHAVISQLGVSSPGRATLRWINASVGQNLRVITVDEVLYFQADNKYTRVVTDEGEALIRKPLKELVDELDPHQFWQIHRSTLVNASAIDRIARDLRGRMVVHVKGSNDTLLISDSYAHLFRQM